MAGNRKFHNKFHSANHHTLPSPHIKDSGLDPIASHDFPFIGDFVLNGVVSASNNYLLNNRQLASTLDTVPHGQPVPEGWHVFRDSTYVDGDMTITGNLSALGELTYLHTQVEVTSATEMEIRADNSNNKTAALLVDQYGKNDIVHFKNDGISTFLITGSANNSETLGGWIGINLGNLDGVNRPNQRMTVVGSVSVVPDPYEAANQLDQKDAGTSGSLYIEGGLHVNDQTHLDQVTIDTTDGKFLVSGGNNDISANIFDVDVPTLLDAVTADTTDGDFRIHGTNKVYIDTEDEDLVGLDVDTHTKLDKVTVDTTDGAFRVEGPGDLELANDGGLDVDSETRLDKVNVDTNDGKFLIESSDTQKLPGDENPLDVDVPTLLDRVTINTDDGKLYIHGNPAVQHSQLNPVDIDVPTLLDMVTIDTTDGDMSVHGPGKIFITTYDSVDMVGLDVVTPTLLRTVTVNVSAGDFLIENTTNNNNKLDVDVPVELSKTTIDTDTGKLTVTGSHPQIKQRVGFDINVPLTTTGGIVFNTTNAGEDIIFQGTANNVVFEQTDGTVFNSPVAINNQLTIDTTIDGMLIKGSKGVDINTDVDISDAVLHARNIDVNMTTAQDSVSITGQGSLDIDVYTNITNTVAIKAPTTIDVTDGPFQVFDSQTSWNNKQKMVIATPLTTRALSADVTEGDVEIVGFQNKFKVSPISVFDSKVTFKSIVDSKTQFNSYGTTNLHKTVIDTTDGILEINGPNRTVVDTNTTFNRDVYIKGDIRVDGNAYLSAGTSGKIHVGDSVDDSVVFTADVDSDIQPNTSDTYRLGDNEFNRWLSVDSKYGEFEQLGAITTNTSGSNIAGHFDVNTITSNDNITFRGVGTTRILTPITTYNQLSAVNGPWIFGGVEEDIVDPIESIGPDGLTYVDPPETLPAFRVECRSLFQNSLTALGPVQIGDLPDGVNEQMPDPTFEVLGTAVIRDGNLKIQSDIRHLHDNSTAIRFDKNLLDFRILDESIFSLTQRGGAPLVSVGNVENDVIFEIHGNVGINGRNDIEHTLGKGVDLHGNMRVTETLSARTLVVDYLTVLEQSSGNVGGGGGSAGGSGGVFATLSGDCPAGEITNYFANGAPYTYDGVDTGVEFDASTTPIGDVQKLYSVTFKASQGDANLGVVAGDTQTSTFLYTTRWDENATQAYVNSTEYGITHTSNQRFAQVVVEVLKSQTPPFTERVVKLVVKSDVDCDFYIHNVVVQDKPERIDAVSIADLDVLGTLTVESEQVYDNKITFNDHVTFSSFVSSDILPGVGATLGNAFHSWTEAHISTITSTDIITDDMTTNTLTTIGDVHIKGDLRVDGTAYLSAGDGGVINVGDTRDDVITFHGDLSGSLLPESNGLYDIGSELDRWSGVYAQELSVTGDVVWAGGNSIQSNSVWSNMLTNSANWDEGYRIVFKEPRWDSTWSAVYTNSANWDTAHEQLALSASDWNTTREDVLSKRDQWNSVWSAVYTNSANWDTAHEQLALSASDWNITSEQFAVSSALWNAGQGQTATQALNWNAAYNAVSTTSANWDQAYALAADTQRHKTWDDVYTWVYSDSATNNKTYNDDTYLKQTGGTVNGDLYVTGNLRVDGNAYLSAGASGSINVGDQDTDNVVFNAEIASDLIPDSDNMFDISTPQKRWKDIHLSGTANIDGVVRWNGGDSEQSNETYNFISTTSGTDGFANLVQESGQLVLDHDQLPSSAITKVHVAFNDSDVAGLTDVSDPQKYRDVFEGHVVVIIGSNVTLIATENNPTGEHIITEDRWEGYQELFIPTGVITQVNGQTGPTVALNADDIDDDSTTHKFVTVDEKTNLLSTQTTVHNNSGNWQWSYNEVNIGSPTWDQTTSTVQTNSAGWEYSADKLVAKEANWDSAHEIASGYVQNTQAIYNYIENGRGYWNDTYTVVAASSATWNTPDQGTTTTLTRVSNKISNPSGEREYVALQSGNPNKDTVYDNISHEHAMVLPQDMVLRRVIIRGGIIGGVELNLGVHTNKLVTDQYSKQYIYFDDNPLEEQTKRFTNNNQSQIYDFTLSANASAGDTFGLSLSADQPLENLSMTVVMEHPDYVYTPITRAVYDPSDQIQELQEQIIGLQSQVSQLLGEIPDPTFRVTISDIEENIKQRDDIVTGTIAFATDTTKLLVFNREDGVDRWVEFDNN